MTGHLAQIAFARRDVLQLFAEEQPAHRAREVVAPSVAPPVGRRRQFARQHTYLGFRLRGKHWIPFPHPLLGCVFEPEMQKGRRVAPTAFGISVPHSAYCEGSQSRRDGWSSTNMRVAGVITWALPSHAQPPMRDEPAAGRGAAAWGIPFAL